MKPFILYIICVLCGLSMSASFGQPPINERYIIEGESNSIFSTVIATDSCYYVSGLQTSSPSYEYVSSHFIQYNFDGSIENVKIIENDTLGIAFSNRSQMIKTLDGHFVHIAIAKGFDIPFSFIFVKMNANGDTLCTRFYSDFFEDEELNGKNPSTIIQNNDSTFYALVHIQREDDGVGGIVFFRIDKNGNLISSKSFFGVSIESYNTLRSASLVQLSENRFIIGAAYRKDYGYTEELRHHTKLIMVDSLGEVIEEHTYWDDPLSLDCNGLTKTDDGGLLYCGRIGEYFPDFGGVNLYKGRIVKLNSAFEEEWEIILSDTYKYSEAIALNNIKQLNETEFVSVGKTISTIDSEVNNYGWLIKFNIAGELLWQRKYIKIPNLGSENAIHRLYDVDITPDNGFVMVGDAINFYEDPDHLYGQKAWLIKVDSFGCLVPGCQELDLSISENPTNYTGLPIYPNPAKNSLFYYHHQDNFEPVNMAIYSTSGQLVQFWRIVSNDITYEVDIANLESGMYVLTATLDNGIVLETQQFVKE